MSLTWFIILAVVYFIGLITVQWLDKVFSIHKNKYHYLVLFIMWVLTPIIMAAFLFSMISRFIKRTLFRQSS